MSEEQKVQIEFVGELQRLDVQPGDKFVIHTTQNFTTEILRRIYDNWKQLWVGDNAPPLLILPPDMKLGVIRQEKPDDQS